MKKNIKNLVNKTVVHKHFGQCVVLKIVSESKGRITIEVIKTKEVKKIVFTPRAFEDLNDYPDYLEANFQASNLSKNNLSKDKVVPRKKHTRKGVAFFEEHDVDEDYEAWLNEINDDKDMDRGYLEDLDDYY